MKILAQLSLMTSACVLALAAHAQNLPTDDNARLRLGAVASFKSGGYDTDNNVGAAPLFLYDNNRVYLEGSEGGVYAYKDNENWLRAGLGFDGRSFDPDDAKTSQLQGMDKRKASANAYVSYMRITPVGGFEVKAATDILDRSGGQSVSLAHRSKFDFMNGDLTVYPKAGVTWYSDDYNQYYYGVSADEAARTGVSVYQADAGFSPFVSASAFYQINDRVSLFGNQKFEWLSSEQKRSPLTDSSVESSTNLGLLYQF
ncbi:hypothetical protein B0181_02135 [Moraxella caviae]|uniref:MltA-interacting protein n=1 Tax=Moraxella caviae TaxID=34060 RepID=A0A1T0A8Z3_9GAMM|nr:MipA/OmpV family protein [Moraxella caviae]OOR92099.1 hypothetical protein B0181_02135 [Moraxella caviae]STZ14456.1 MltA-interacting protein precursor [Moraxella caviae]